MSSESSWNRNPAISKPKCKSLEKKSEISKKINYSLDLFIIWFWYHWLSTELFENNFDTVCPYRFKVCRSDSSKWEIFNGIWIPSLNRQLFLLARWNEQVEMESMPKSLLTCHADMIPNSSRRRLWAWFRFFQILNWKTKKEKPKLISLINSLNWMTQWPAKVRFAAFNETRNQLSITTTQKQMICR